MYLDPLDIASWKSRVSSDPDKATELFLSKIAVLPDDLKQSVFAHVRDKEGLLKNFRDAASRADEPLGAVPFLLKDLFHVADVPTRAGSAFLQDVINLPEESSKIYDMLVNAGAVYCGKTQLNEFAYGLTGRNKNFGNCPHPYIKGALSGGSSSGSAWAVSRRIVPIAFGTDTGGSIRVPASFCNIYGMRLQPGGWSSDGVFPLAPSFDAAGWFAATPEDMLTVNHALIPNDQSRDASIKGAFINPNDGGAISDDLSEKYQIAAKALGFDENLEIKSLFNEVFKPVLSTYTALQSKEAFEVHESWLDLMKDHYNSDVWKRIDRGRHWSMAELDQANMHREKIKEVFKQYFKSYDVLLMPAVPAPSYDSSQFTTEFRNNLLALNAPASIAGLPVLTLPVELENSQSVGLQAIFPSLDKAMWAGLLNRILPKNDSK